MTKHLENKPILVATDMSHRGDRAMQRAFSLGRKAGLKVIVFTALDDAMPQDMTTELEQKALDRLQRHADSLGSGVEVEVRVTVGDPTEEILRIVETVDPGLVIMGVHRARGFLDGLRETTMQRIVRRTDRPVLLVRDPVDHTYRSILAATDFSPASTAAMQLSASMWPTADIAALHALHVPFSGMLGPANAGKDELEAAFLKDTRIADRSWREGANLPDTLAPETRIEIGPAYSVVRQAAEATSADLICVGAHGRVGAVPSILGSLATDLMRDAPCDLLIARP